MSDSSTTENNNNRRRSRRIAAKVSEDKPQLIDIVLADIEKESQPLSRKKSEVNASRKKIYRNANKSKLKDDDTGTLFDNGLQAVSIIGATSVDDEAKGTSDLCYLVKYENGQFELVMNKVAHKFCPMLVIDFLESRILFDNKDEFDLSRELFGNSSSQLSEIPETQMSQFQHSNRSIEI